MYPYWQSQGAAKAMFSQATAVKSVWIVLVIFFFQITKHKAVLYRNRTWATKTYARNRS